MRVKGANSGVYGWLHTATAVLYVLLVFLMKSSDNGLTNNTGGLILGKCSSHEFEFPYVAR
jgi:hypothetical protein